MTITIGKILGLLVALGYVTIGIVAEGGFTDEVLKLCLVLMWPVLFIWFPDEIGSMTGYFARGQYISKGTPPFLISIAGWFFLVGLPVLMYFLAR